MARCGGGRSRKFGAVTHLTVKVYGVGEQIVCGPIHSTPLFALLTAHGHDPGIFAECARQGLAQIVDRRADVRRRGRGTSLVLEGEIVGAAVAGYAPLDFSQRVDIDRLARDAPARR